MGSRLDLQTLLEGVLGSGNVYFQPPETIKLEYPCIVYSRAAGNTDFANNVPYQHYARYSVVLLDYNPDTGTIHKLVHLPMCLYDRHYTMDNLNHDVFTLYF